MIDCLRFVLLTMVVLITMCVCVGQEMDPETRARFVAEQDVYLESLGLSIDQRKAYQQITINFEKLFQTLDQSTKSASFKKKHQKKLVKAKHAEMKNVLSPGQFKRYRRRQKEIEKNYL
ncbi:MAG: hypothetical protein AAGA85_18780 [Bacteroidota bacterium]